MRVFSKGRRRPRRSHIDNASRATVVQSEPGTPSESLPPTHIVVLPLGVKVLYCPADPETDICFIHGLSGNRESTWTAKGREKSWPEDLLPDRVPKARILTIGFNACITENVKRGYKPSKNSLNEHARNCLLDLVNERADSLQRPILFVVHSIGGLVCKKMILLSQSHQDAEFRDVFESLRGVIFLGTPHQGSWLADFARLPATTLGFFKPISVSLLDILETDNQVLEDLQKEFLTMLRKALASNRRIDVVCFYEEQPSYGRLMIVPSDSAILDSYEHYGIAANHRDMVKYASMEDNGFRRVSGLLKRWQKPVELEVKPTPSFVVPTLRVRNAVVGDGGRQELRAAIVDAEGIIGGDNAFQSFSDGGQLEMLEQAIVENQNNRIIEAQDEEGEVVTVSSSSSNMR